MWWDKVVMQSSVTSRRADERERITLHYCTCSVESDEELVVGLLEITTKLLEITRDYRIMG